MVRIPAGRFIFQNGARRNLPDYWISRHEVTIGQYADFIAAIACLHDDTVAEKAYEVIYRCRR